MNDFGEFYWPDGNKYIGFYKDDKKCGLGVFQWPKSNKIFIGIWENGKQHGVGISIHNKEIRYGVWEEGARKFWLKGPWQFDKYLNDDQDKYLHFLKKDPYEIINIYLP
jgi:hypothetical protein